MILQSESQPSLNSVILFPPETALVRPRLEESRIELPDNYIIECSNDMQYLRQYYFIREYAYRYDLKVVTFSGDEDEIDRSSHILIARKGHFCVGGARLTISTQRKRQRLPLERGNFDVLENVPMLQGSNYCELGRTAILPQYRDGEFLRTMFDLAAIIARQYQCHYMVGVSPPPVARHFKKTYLNLGYDTKILKNVSPPHGSENQHLNLQFIIVRLDQQPITEEY